MLDPKRDIPVGTLKSIEKQAGIKLREGWTPRREKPWNILRICIRKRVGFWSELPGFPGCVTAGETLEEARELGRGSLTLHIGGMTRTARPSGAVHD